MLWILKHKLTVMICMSVHVATSHKRLVNVEKTCKTTFRIGSECLFIEYLVSTARHVCIARTLPWQDVRLSVCPSVCHTPVLCLNNYTYPQSFFTVGSPTILVFPYQTGWQYSDGNPLNGDVECMGVWKNHDFRPISCFTSELMQDRAIVAMEGE